MSQFLPGYEAGRAREPREVLWTRDGMIQAPIVVDKTARDGGNGDFPDEIRAGWLLGRVSATGRWVPCKRTRVSAGGGATAATIPVDNADAFVVGDVIRVGADADKTVAAVDYDASTLTVSGAAFPFADGEAVVSQDGSAVCRGILLDFVRLRDADGAAVHKSAGLLIQGAVKTGMLLGDLAAIRADASARLAGIRFSDEHGQ